MKKMLLAATAVIFATQVQATPKARPAKLQPQAALKVVSSNTSVKMPVKISQVPSTMKNIVVNGAVTLTELQNSGKTEEAGVLAAAIAEGVNKKTGLAKAPSEVEQKFKTATGSDRDIYTKLLEASKVKEKELQNIEDTKEIAEAKRVKENIDNALANAAVVFENLTTVPRDVIKNVDVQGILTGVVALSGQYENIESVVFAAIQNKLGVDSDASGMAAITKMLAEIAEHCRF